MTGSHMCDNCGWSLFRVNGYEVHSYVTNPPKVDDPQQVMAMKEAFDESDVGKVDIIEIVCDNCNEPYSTIEGGHI